MTEIAILREYQNSELVQKVLDLVEGTTPCAPETRQAASRYLATIWREAMKKAGIVATLGQYEFADCIFFDLQMSDKDKIYWLSLCEGQEERVEALRASK